MNIKKTFPYHSPTPGEFPMVTSGPNDYQQEVTEDHFRTLASCGFNSVLFSGVERDDPKFPVFMEKAFRFGHKFGIKIIVHNALLFFEHEDYTGQPPSGTEEWRKVFYNLLEEYRSHPALGGWQIKDEPGLDELIDGRLQDRYVKMRCHDIMVSMDEYRQMGYLSDEPNTKYPENGYDPVPRNPNPHLVMFNLYADDGETKIGPKGYLSYLRKIKDDVKPEVWSFDFYPVNQIPGKRDLAVRLKKMNKYFNAVRTVSKESDTPFWSYILTSQHMNYGTTSTYGIAWQYACPTHHIMRMQAYVGLAYGAKGLVFWPFHQPQNQYGKTWEKDSMIFLCGPSMPKCSLADGDPETTEAADNRILRDICRLTRDLKKWTPLFLDCEVTNVEEVSYYDMKKTNPEKNHYPDNAMFKWDDEMGLYVPETEVVSDKRPEPVSHALLETPVGCIEKLKVIQEAGVLVSRFISSEGRYYTMVVNQNPVGAQRVEITHNPKYAGILKKSLTNEGRFVHESIQTSNTDPATWHPLSMIYEIQPGDCMIFEENSVSISNDVH